MGQQLESFLAVGTITQGSRSFGSKSVDVAQILFENITVKKEERVKSLILRRSSDPIQGQACEESFHLFVGLREGFGSWAFEERGVAQQPMGIGFLSLDSDVLEGTSFSE